ALALDLGVNDKEAIRTIYPDDRIYVTANEAKRRHLSIFGLPVFRNARRYLGEQAATLPLYECQSHVSRVEGWAFDGMSEQVPQEVFLVDSNYKVVGVGLTGFPRTDVAQVVNRKASFSGFDAYVFGDMNNIRPMCAR